MLLLQGCSSDSGSDNSNSIILCKTIKYNETTSTNVISHRDEFTYDGNKLIQTNAFRNDVLNRKSLFFYTGDLITQVKTYNSSNQLIYLEVYTYNNSNQLIQSISYDQGILDVRETYSYNQNGTINKLTYYNYGQPQEILSENTTFSINNGNLVSINKIEYSLNQNNKLITFVYDDKNSPFRNLNPSVKFILMDSEFFNSNNAINRTETNSDPIYSNRIDNYQYLYNSDNYPTVVTSSSPNSNIAEFTY